jgi:hypothetical protein
MSAIDDTHPDLTHVASEVEILSDTRYRFRGELRDTQAAGLVPLSETGRPVHLEGGKSRLLAFIESELYQRLYRRPADGVGRSVVSGGADHAFIESLSEANTGSGTWQPGWRFAGLAPDGLLGVAKDVTCWVPASDVRPPEGGLRPGAACRVRVPKEVRHLVLGYYLAIGDAEPRLEDGDEAGTVRLYWSLTPAAAPRYLRRLTTIFNEREIPFRSKVVAHSALYQNADAGVLYLAKEDFARSVRPLRRLHRDLARGLRDTVPLFTKRLAAGLGLAEDPLDGSSFGQSRCRIAAQGLWADYFADHHHLADQHRLADHLAGGRSAEDRLRALATAFQGSGLDPARPYLRPHSEDIYAFS